MDLLLTILSYSENDSFCHTLSTGTHLKTSNVFCKHVVFLIRHRMIDFFYVTFVELENEKLYNCCSCRLFSVFSVVTFL